MDNPTAIIFSSWISVVIYVLVSTFTTSYQTVTRSLECKTQLDNSQAVYVQVDYKSYCVLSQELVELEQND